MRHNLRLGADNHQFAAANANLASEVSRLQAEISQLQLKAKPTLEQQRAMLVYSAAITRFRQLEASRYRSIGSALHDPSAYWLAMGVWQEHYPGVSPPAPYPHLISDYG